jgi:hypothetical protein
MAEVPELFEHHLSTGHVAVYRLRVAPVGADWVARTYTPAGMSDSVYLDQFATLRRPIPSGTLG